MTINRAKPTNDDISIEGTDFVPSTPTDNQTCALIFGYGGSGKTTFVTDYCPDPIALINFDRRGRPAIQKAQAKGRKIFPAEIGFPGNILRMSDDKSKQVAQASLDRFFKNLEWAKQQADKGNIRTIAIDTGTELADIMSVAAKGLIGQPKKDYGASKGLINRQWISMFLDVRASGAHFIILSRASEIWKGNEPTGRFKHKLDETAYDLVDWAGQVRMQKHKKGERPKFELEITKAGINSAELGEIYTEDDWLELGGPFVYACMLQYEGTDVEDWQ